jgi:tRNA nucleotidyltransferase/poly(A) polymerase
VIRDYVRSLGLDAYVVGGSVRDELLGLEHRDEDFLVPAHDQERLRTALKRYGRVEDIVVHQALKGVRLHPRDRVLRELAPAGIEITPAAGSLEDDLRRRDFTVNAIARSLDSGELVDPLGGLHDLASRQVRLVSREAFRDDPLRLLRALRLVSQLGFDVAGETIVEMRAAAGAIRDVAPERIGGGLAADGQGELSLLLMGDEPARALRLGRDTGVLTGVLPEFGTVLGLTLDSPRQPLSVDEHIFAVVQATAEADATLRVRLAALLHDLGKPGADVKREPHADVGAALAAAALERLRYPTRLVDEVASLVRAHSFRLDAAVDARTARRFLARHGGREAADLVLLKEADLHAKTVPAEELVALDRLRTLLDEQRESPHRLSDLAVDGNDLIALGIREGPEIGRILHVLLDEVVEEPARNERDLLLARAREATR